MTAQNQRILHAESPSIKEGLSAFMINIPQKTKGHHANIVRVPLNQTALDILERYKELDEAHPLYEVTSSHTARKTFIGNLYK